MTIIQTATNKWTVNNGKGTELTLVKQDTGWAWGVIAHNARTRCSMNQYAGSFKGFDSLEAVERHYKSFRGIAATLNSPTPKMGHSMYPTCIQQINYPVHNGKPNPAHGKFSMVGAVPAGCYDFEAGHSKFYETEQAAIDDAVKHGATRIQNTKCEFVLGGR